MRGRNLTIAAIAALALAVIALWWFTTYERVQRWVDLPPRGEPSYNPLYALKLALRADGVRAQTRQRLDLDGMPLGPHDTVVIYSDPRTLTALEADRLMAWVARGGHLVMRMPAYEYGRSTHRLTGPLTAHLPLQPQLGEPDCVRLQARDAKPVVEFCLGARFRLRSGTEAEIAWGSAGKGLAYARLDHGRGQVDVLSDLRLLANTALREPTRAAFARQLLAPAYGQGTVHLVYAADMPPLWRWLLARAWMALLPLALALPGWLWMRMQRLGPLLPSPPEARRSLLEHVQASGEHLYRYGRAALLQTAVRDAVQARLRRRDPLTAALPVPMQADALAARTGLAREHVASTLDSRAPEGANDFTARISRLIALRHRL